MNIWHLLDALYKILYCLNTHFNKAEKTDNNFILNYCDLYVEKLELKTNDRTGELGTSKATITKYKTIKLKIKRFQEYKPISINCLKLI